MPLPDVHVPCADLELPGAVRAFLAEAERRIEAFQLQGRVPAFVASDFVHVYRVLAGVRAAQAAPGNLFCEWGSGFGVVACLAAMLGFDAVGIEVDAELVHAARRLADDFCLSLTFMCGSFVPRSSAHESFEQGDVTWLTTDQPPVAVEPDAFDVIFAYPWPAEEDEIGKLFERHARPGALLVTYHADGTVRVRRQRGRKSRRSQD